MSLWSPHAFASKHCLPCATESIERCQFRWVPPHCPKAVSYRLLDDYLRLKFPLRSMSNISSTRSKLGRDDIKWSELLSHFRSVQNKHEKARRQAHGTEYREPMSDSSIQLEPAPVTTMNGTNSNRPPIRRKGTGSEASVLQRPPSRALSPLNPRARVQGTFVSPFTGQPQTSPPAHLQAVQRQQKRTISVNRGPPK